MREIKFRAFIDGKMMYRVDGLNWIGGDSVTSVQCITHEETGLGDGYDIGDQVTALMQFSSLKDKKGRDIYEGDIVRSLSQPSYRPAEVHWDTEGAGWYVRFNSDERYKSLAVFGEWRGDLEVIGNIYENPELLN